MELGGQQYSRPDDRYHRPARIYCPDDEMGGDRENGPARRIRVCWRRNVLTAVKVVLLPAR